MKKIKSIVVIVLLSLVSLGVSAQEKATNDGKIPVSTGRYITGGILGSTVGFGIGHGVQGRYQDKGWIYTVGEVAGLVIFAPALRKCADEKDQRTDKECTSSEKSQMGIGYAVALGFHIWEIIDVWTAATPVDTNVSAFILPTGDTVQTGLVYRF